MGDAAEDLLAFVDAAPSPYHVTAALARRLETAGFSRLDEGDAWQLQPGGAHYVVRDAGSLIAFRLGTDEPARAGFRLIGAHTDSPTLKVRPVADVRRHGYHQLSVEPYGGVLLHTWFDRDLTLAGRVAVREPSTGAVATQLVHLPGAPLRVPSLAIHLNREIREQGLKIDPQTQLAPVWGADDGDGDLSEVLAEALAVDGDAILGHDLVTADTQPAARGGADDAWLLAPRLDNLLSCHAGLLALCATEPQAHSQVLVANDHEESGSGSAEGARGTFLADVLARIVAATSDGEPQPPLAAALARSLLVSADTAHAVHPNYADRHDPQHRPRFGAGPVIKVNANQAYATDAATGGWFAACCADADVGVQYFVSRADLPCGSTIGPLTATRLGVATVDVGSPLLSMHSCREQAAAADVEPMIAALRAHLERPERPASDDADGPR